MDSHRVKLLLFVIISILVKDSLSDKLSDEPLDRAAPVDSMVAHTLAKDYLLNLISSAKSELGRIEAAQERSLVHNRELTRRKSFENLRKSIRGLRKGVRSSMSRKPNQQQNEEPIVNSEELPYSAVQEVFHSVAEKMRQKLQTYRKSVYLFNLRTLNGRKLTTRRGGAPLEVEYELSLKVLDKGAYHNMWLCEVEVLGKLANIERPGINQLLNFKCQDQSEEENAKVRDHGKIIGYSRKSGVSVTQHTGHDQMLQNREEQVKSTWL